MSGAVWHRPVSTTRRGSLALGFLTALALTHAQALGAGAQGISGDLAVILDVPGASSTPRVGETILVWDVTRNVSSNSAAASTTAIYLSASSTFDGNAIVLGGRAVPPLGPGETNTGSAPYALPAGHAGIRYLFAVADAHLAIVEGNEGNNVSAAWPILIGADLVVWIDVPGSITSAVAGSTVVVSDWTRSDNSAPVEAPTTTRYYLVTGTTVDANAIPLQSRSIPALPASTTNTGTTTLTLPANVAGTFRLVAKADADGSVLETNEGNNVSGASPLFAIGPDLVMRGVSAVVDGETTIRVTDITRNRGTTRVEGSTTRFYLSADTSFDAGDVLLGSRAIPALEPRTEDARTTPLTLPPGTAGTYRIIAVAGDATHPESDKTNNSAFSSAIAIGPDLTVLGVSVPRRAAPGARGVDVSDFTKNLGAGAAGASTTAYYLSRDTVLGPGDVFLGSRTLNGLAPRATDSQGTTVDIPGTTMPGCYFIIAAADNGQAVQESDETNNAPQAVARGTVIAPPGRTPACAASDFDGDGKSDILWRHETGAVHIWFMSGGAVRTTESPATVGSDWTIQGVGDFNSDGKADILWRHETGLVHIWIMDGGAVRRTESPPTVGLDWTIQGVGDFNGDGKADILWWHESGLVHIWFMNGGAVLGAESPATVGSDWAIQGVGDFNGDGKSDILWRHESGLVQIWFMDGGSISGAENPATVGLDWTVQDVGDLNSDGKADILWRHETGVMHIWLMDGGGVRSAESPPTVGLDWIIQGVGDFNGDRKADILWRHESGLVHIWFMDGGGVSGTGSPATLGLDWRIH